MPVARLIARGSLRAYTRPAASSTVFVRHNVKPIGVKHEDEDPLAERKAYTEDEWFRKKDRELLQKMRERHEAEVTAVANSTLKELMKQHKVPLTPALEADLRKWKKEVSRYHADRGN
eukprot:gb/GEZN01022583.1/.p2 GENE.gb/GEZN01022583.1/~~gb/GEZN01022583.1/.p2  ORF type:complete len:118 (+),score=28.11 gb/GEZN01022583.1/:41-394(+)